MVVVAREPSHSSKCRAKPGKFVKSVPQRGQNAPPALGSGMSSRSTLGGAGEGGSVAARNRTSSWACRATMPPCNVKTLRCVNSGRPHRTTPHTSANSGAGIWKAKLGPCQRAQEPFAENTHRTKGRGRCPCFFDSHTALPQVKAANATVCGRGCNHGRCDIQPKHENGGGWLRPRRCEDETRPCTYPQVEYVHGWERTASRHQRSTVV
jgi:hypothetical protein